MPNVTLRLDDEQHAELTASAERNHRSLQKEIVHRLFTQREAGPLRIDVSARDAKPDPKPTKAEKKGRR